MAAVDQAPAEAGVLGGQPVEMHLGGVLEQARGDLVLGLLDGHAVDVVDLLTDRVIREAVRAAGEVGVVGGGREGRRGVDDPEDAGMVETKIEGTVTFDLLDG